MILYLLYEDSSVKVCYDDIKTAIQEAMRLSLVLVRLRVRDDGVATVMTIYAP